MKAAMIGDNCIDYYKRLNRLYPTGNVVDTGVNLQQLGISTSIISTTGSDQYGLIRRGGYRICGFPRLGSQRLLGKCGS